MKSNILAITILLYGIGLRNPSTVSAGEFGTEIDAIPYTTGGYYGSMWYGFGSNRVRAIVTKVNIPGFMTKSGFSNERTDAYAVIIDRFFGTDAHNRTGLWIGAGMEYWKNSIERENHAQSSEYDSFMLTLGTGYVKYITSRLYVNPWIAAHIRTFGDKDVIVSDTTYSPSVFTPEASIKLGWVF